MRIIRRFPKTGVFGYAEIEGTSPLAAGRSFLFAVAFELFAKGSSVHSEQRCGVGAVVVRRLQTFPNENRLNDLQEAIEETHVRL